MHTAKEEGLYFVRFV